MDWAEVDGMSFVGSGKWSQLGGGDGICWGGRVDWAEAMAFIGRGRWS